MEQKRILVAEDDAPERELLSQALEMLGYIVIPTENGQSALDIYDDQGADLILSDYQMPHMNGLDLLKAIRDRDDQLPFIILTGFDDSETRKEAEKHNVTEFLLKPFRLLHLRNLLDKLLSQEQSTPE